MTPNLIELIVQAVKEAAHTRNYITGISITEDQLRTAIASIPEMPQVDLKQIEKYIQHTPDCAISVAHFDAIYYHITEIPNCTCGLSELLTSPPTKTE